MCRQGPTHPEQRLNDPAFIGVAPFMAESRLICLLQHKLLNGQWHLVERALARRKDREPAWPSE